MSDYKTMYLHLFRSVTEAMELLCEAQKKAEEMYLHSAEQDEKKGEVFQLITQQPEG